MHTTILCDFDGTVVTAPACCRLGNCKWQAVELWRPRGGRVVYVGDGLSDACGADAADLVFAKRLLVDYCQEHSIRFHPFHNFADIMAELIGLPPLETIHR